jgi:hypothetical protein
MQDVLIEQITQLSTARAAHLACERRTGSGHLVEILRAESVEVG